MTFKIQNHQDYFIEEHLRKENEVKKINQDCGTLSQLAVWSVRIHILQRRISMLMGVKIYKSTLNIINHYLCFIHKHVQGEEIESHFIDVSKKMHRHILVQRCLTDQAIEIGSVENGVQLLDWKK